MTRVERYARAICRAHFSRKQHVGACTKEERLDFMEEAHWKTFISDARIVISYLETH